MSVRQGEILRAGPADLASGRHVEQFLRESILGGRDWFTALLEATSLWTAPEETHEGRHYRYLIGGEAFDWMLLAERLCATVEDIVPEQEMTNLLFYGRPPTRISQNELAGTLGMVKHSMYLNFWYGVIVEESLQWAVREEIEKRFAGRILTDRFLRDATFHDIYDADWGALFAQFRTERGLSEPMATSPIEQREFTYWLFKHRVRHGEPARVASDTRKGMRRLADLQQCSLHLVEGYREQNLLPSLQSLLTG